MHLIVTIKYLSCPAASEKPLHSDCSEVDGVTVLLLDGAEDSGVDVGETVVYSTLSCYLPLRFLPSWLEALF